MTRNYGWKPQLFDQRDFKLTLHSSNPSTLPNSVDLRSGMAPIWDQNQENSCTAHASAAVIDFERGLQGFLRWTPSRQAIYYLERKTDGSLKQGDTGSYLRTAAKVLATYGVANETLFPYTNPLTKAPDKVFLAEAIKHKSSVYQAIQQDRVHLQSVLSGQAFPDGKGRPIMFGFTVYESFESNTVAQTGIMPVPHQGEKVVGGHAISVCGYDNTTQMYLCRNSWGTSWGLQGYFWMPFSVLEGQMSSDFWTIQTVTG